MPRAICENKDQLTKWCEIFIGEKGKDKYVIISTNQNEIIIEPRKSTKPLDFAYMQVANGNIKEIVNEIVQKYGIKHLHVKRLEWDLEKPPGIKYQTLEEVEE